MIPMLPMKQLMNKLMLQTNTMMVVRSAVMPGLKVVTAESSMAMAELKARMMRLAMMMRSAMM